MTARKLAKTSQAQWVFALLALYCGAAFFLLGMLGLSAMAPNQYGQLAVSFEIETMAAVQLSAAMMVCAGLMVNGRWRWSPALRLAGATVIVALVSGLACGSILAPDGWPFSVYLVGFSGFGCLVIWWNLVDLRAAIFWGAEDGEPS